MALDISYDMFSDYLFPFDLKPGLHAIGRSGGRHASAEAGGFFGGKLLKRAPAWSPGLLIQTLHEERACHGYELIKTTGDRSGGLTVRARV